MRSKAAGQVINCWQTAVDPMQTIELEDEWRIRILAKTVGSETI